MPLAFLQSKTLNSFSLGDSISTRIGTKVQSERIKLFFFAVVLSCASVTLTGGVGFVVLFSPHLTRRLV
ncbi:iron chelate uptake ABC transporter family permease subunit [Lysinibacillus agricola]|uniref:iron chelate uptake ABC transporter family permease subunit n=1 Tax=Lysinibacillus agricola TaxID=2590012 RepID=UPI003C222945